MYGERRTTLHFSRIGTAVQTITGLAATAVCFWFAFELGFRAEDLAENGRHHRNEWFWDMLRSNHGLTGTILFVLIGGLFCLWTWRAGRRLAAAGEAALLTKRGLLLHPSYAKEEIPFHEIVSTQLWRNRLFVHSLFIRLPDRRKIVLSAVAISGGRNALKAFAAELNARLAG
jgi:hypothetical protein